ncbi:MAG: hypothetical protein AAFW81_02780 [Pseudomonadota bacterium]
MLSDVAELFEGAAAPSPDRRATRRFADAWTQSGRGGFPSWTQLKRIVSADDLDWMYVVDCDKSAGFPFFVFMGLRLSRLSDIFVCGDADTGLSVLDKVTADVSAAIAGEAPHFREETLTLCDGRRLQMRAVTAPLSENGDAITHVAGAVSGRVAATDGSTLRLA